MDVVLRDVYLLSEILKFLHFKDRIYTYRQISSHFRQAVFLLWDCIDLRSFPHSTRSTKSSQHSNDVSIALPLFFDFKQLFGPFVNNVRFSNLRTLKLGNPPVSGIRSLFISLWSANVPNLESVEVYWTDPATDISYIGIPPVIQSYLDQNDNQEFLHSVTSQRRSFSSLPSFPQLKRVVIDFPMSDVDLEGLIPFILNVRILVLSRLMRFTSNPAFFSLVEGLDSLDPHCLQCLCLKESCCVSDPFEVWTEKHEQQSTSGRQMHSDLSGLIHSNDSNHFDSTPQSINDDADYSLTGPSRFSLSNKENDASFIDLSPESPRSDLSDQKMHRSYNARLRAKQFLDKCLVEGKYRDRSLLLYNGNRHDVDESDGLILGDELIKIITKSQNTSLKYFLAPDLYCSYSAFSEFIRHCENIEVWDLPLWRTLYLPQNLLITE